ncbi:hypothetical protein NKJ95_32635 [Mesorhizobium sp. M0012]
MQQSGEMAPPSEEKALAKARRRIAELEQKVGQQQLDLNFFSRSLAAYQGRSPAEHRAWGHGIFEVIEKMTTGSSHGIERMCWLAGVSRASGYHRHWQSSAADVCSDGNATPLKKIRAACSTAIGSRYTGSGRRLQLKGTERVLKSRMARANRHTVAEFCSRRGKPGPKAACHTARHENLEGRTIRSVLNSPELHANVREVRQRGCPNWKDRWVHVNHGSLRKNFTYSPPREAKRRPGVALVADSSIG